MVKEKKFDEVYCSSCGDAIKKQAEICPHCGVKQHIDEGKELSRKKAGWFGILFGGLGVHKFYLGQTGMGILYLVFFWTIIPAIVGFIEGIILLCMDEKKFQKKYCK